MSLTVVDPSLKVVCSGGSWGEPPMEAAGVRAGPGHHQQGKDLPRIPPRVTSKPLGGQEDPLLGSFFLDPEGPHTQDRPAGWSAENSAAFGV